MPRGGSFTQPLHHCKFALCFFHRHTLYMAAKGNPRQLSHKSRRRCKNGTHRNPMTHKCRKIHVSHSSSNSGHTTDDVTYLKAICNDANMCTAFGIETQKLEEFFQFNTFAYVVGMRNLKEGANGFVNELIYDRGGYRANAILKSMLDKYSDSLYYEAYVGLKYINRFAQQFPCFLKTYGLFKYTAPLQKSFAKINKVAKTEPDTYTSLMRNFAGVFEPIKINDQFSATMACTNYINFACIIEYIASPSDLNTFAHGQLLNKDTADAFFNVELPHILFQIYAVLASLAQDRIFSHNDLHSSNIMIYTIPNGDRVTMTYKNTAGMGTVSFQTRYIAKIIDYGRVYCPESPDIYKTLCNTKECDPNCGEHAGFRNVLKPKNNGKSFGITYDLNAVIYIFQDYILPYIHGKRNDMYATMMRLRYPNDYFFYIDDNPMLHILNSTITNKEAILQKYIEAEEYNVFHTGKDSALKAMPVINTVHKLYWALCYYLQTSPIYRIRADMMYAEGEAPAPFGEFTCDLAFDINHIKPIVFTPRAS